MQLDLQVRRQRLEDKGLNHRVMEKYVEKRSMRFSSFLTCNIVLSSFLSTCVLSFFSNTDKMMYIVTVHNPVLPRPTCLVRIFNMGFGVPLWSLIHPEHSFFSGFEYYLD